MNASPFEPVRVKRSTAETVFELIALPRIEPMTPLPLPNRLLSHFIDHLCKASGINVTLTREEWPGSWCFDHVLCEDIGQLFGKAVVSIVDQRAPIAGVVGRASRACCMDDAHSEVTISLEGRPSTRWTIEDSADIDGFVDSWYDRAVMAGTCYGTNLRQFVDGFSYGSGATVSVRSLRTGNLHHFYETVFRALGDAIAVSLGLDPRLPGDTSGLARAIEYTTNNE